MSEKPNAEQIEAVIAELAEAEAAECQAVQRDYPDDPDIQRDAYYHPRVQAISDKLRQKIVEWHAALPDDHIEFRRRALAPRWVRDQGDQALRTAVDRLHEGGQIEKAQHASLHKAIGRTTQLAIKHRAAMSPTEHEHIKTLPEEA